MNIIGIRVFLVELTLKANLFRLNLLRGRFKWSILIKLFSFFFSVEINQTMDTVVTINNKKANRNEF